MNCPVCHASDLPEDLLKCPQCESDLEVFRFTRKIAKERSAFLAITVIVILALVAFLLFWAFAGPGGKEEGNAAGPEVISENAGLKAELSRITDENVRLAQEVAGLKERLAAEEPQESRRKKEYVVGEGETLFGIARKIYGNGFRFEDLARDNALQDPASIYAGQKLIVYY